MYLIFTTSVTWPILWHYSCKKEDENFQHMYENTITLILMLQLLCLGLSLPSLSCYCFSNFVKKIALHLSSKVVCDLILNNVNPQVHWVKKWRATLIGKKPIKVYVKANQKVIHFHHTFPSPETPNWIDILGSFSLQL